MADLTNDENFTELSNTFKLLEINVGNNNEGKLKNTEKTFVVIVAYQNLSSQLSAKFSSYPEFYLSTALSASLHNQDRCLQDLEEDKITFFTEGCFNYIGKHLYEQVQLQGALDKPSDCCCYPFF